MDSGCDSDCNWLYLRKENKWTEGPRYSNYLSLIFKTFWIFYHRSYNLVTRWCTKLLFITAKGPATIHHCPHIPSSHFLYCFLISFKTKAKYLSLLNAVHFLVIFLYLPQINYSTNEVNIEFSCYFLIRIDK